MNDSDPDKPGKRHQWHADAEEELEASSESVYTLVERLLQDAKVAKVDYSKPQEQGRRAQCQILSRER